MKNFDKIICLGKNYADHIKELNSIPDEKETPAIFIKPPSSAHFINFNCSSPTTIDLDFSDGEIHHEIELIFLIKQKIQRVPVELIAEKIEGYSLGLDLTKRSLQSKLKARGLPWTLSKCFDNSAIIMTPFNKIPFPASKISELKFSLLVNGEVKQRGVASEMLTHPFQAISDISYKMALYPGDIFFSGTPKGVGALKLGDELTLSFEPFIPSSLRGQIRINSLNLSNLE